MIPYPEPMLDTLRVVGHTYRLSLPDERVAASQAFVRELGNRFKASRYSHLVLDSFYWLYEQVHGQDERVVPRIAGGVHTTGFRFLWIPFYTAWGVDDSKRWGFDEAWLQTNYFFEPRIPQVRLDSAVIRARSIGMGLEVEFNGTVYRQPAFYDRLGPYLSALETAPDLRKRSVATYVGAGALIELSKRKNLRDRALYERLVNALSWSDSTSASGEQ